MDERVRFVQYLELQGLEHQPEPLAAARAVAFLHELRRDLERQPTCRSALVLHSLEQPQVYLLQSGWSAPPAALEARSLPGFKVRVWSFAVLDSAAPDLAAPD